MKNRRIVVVALMLVAVLCVGVGYAATNDIIDFTGKITHETSLQLVWDNFQDAAGVTTAHSGEGTDAFTVSINTSEWSTNVPKTFTVDVENPTNFPVTSVTVSTPSGAPANYTVTAVSEDTTIPVGGSTTVTITITMNSYPDSNLTDEPFTFTVTGETA